MPERTRDLGSVGGLKADALAARRNLLSSGRPSRVGTFRAYFVRNERKLLTYTPNIRRARPYYLAFGIKHVHASPAVCNVGGRACVREGGARQ